VVLQPKTHHFASTFFIMFIKTASRFALAAMGLATGRGALVLLRRKAHSAAVFAAVVAVLKHKGRGALPGFKRRLLLAAGTAGAAALGGHLARRQRHRISFAKRVVIITGGSRGLGLVMARQLAREGAHLALLSRDEASLKRAQEELESTGAQVMVVACDVTHQAAVESALARVAERFGGVDVLINNAGVIEVGPLKHMERADFERAMAVHFQGPLNLILAVLPWLRKAGGGRIVNISSIGGKIAVPHLLPYCASKFALTGFSQGLAVELRAENIHVTTVCPGLMRTGSPVNARFKGRHRSEFAWFAIADSMPLLSIGAGRAASRILRACRHGTAFLIVGTPAKAAIWFGSLFPGAESHLASLISGWLPAPDPLNPTASHSGHDSGSSLGTSLLTRPTFRAAARNNEQAARGRRSQNDPRRDPWDRSR
jgi:NAD(P)-dependent dehydrogenase (short-subunit alcohol dehydrogenase family)